MQINVNFPQTHLTKTQTDIKITFVFSIDFITYLVYFLLSTYIFLKCEKSTET